MFPVRSSQCRAWKPLRLHSAGQAPIHATERNRGSPEQSALRRAAMPAELPKQVSIISGASRNKTKPFAKVPFASIPATGPVCRNLPPTAGIQDCLDDCARKMLLASCGHPAICGCLNFSKPCPAPAVLWNRVAKGDELRAGYPDKFSRIA